MTSVRQAPMPALDLNQLAGHLDPEAFALVLRVLDPHTGVLRATRPPVPTHDVPGLWGTPRAVPEPEAARAAYVWRWTVFSLSPRPAHQALPATAYESLPCSGADMMSERARTSARLDEIVRQVIALVPPDARPGLAAWAHLRDSTDYDPAHITLRRLLS